MKKSEKRPKGPLICFFFPTCPRTQHSVFYIGIVFISVYGRRGHIFLFKDKTQAKTVLLLFARETFNNASTVNTRHWLAESIPIYPKLHC